ncbi:TerD family protein [Kitasatospora sp. NPDC127059]|uniref:TerD family protein n=1 Tax=unclassified Kitasatospora TaxID=2633591 RepID=UPI00365ACA0B
MRRLRQGALRAALRLLQQHAQPGRGGAPYRRPSKDATSGDRERIEADLAAVPAAVERIVVAVAIYDAHQRR